jgi:hypothetical protein
MPANVVPFPTTPWQAEHERSRRPAPLPAGEWVPDDHRNGHEPGGQN